MQKNTFKISGNLFDNNYPLLIFSAVYYGVMIFLSFYFNVWEDEIYSLNTTSKGLSYAYHQSLNFEAQPPVWFLLLTVWRVFSDSILWARLFSMFLIIISEVVLYRFIKQISDKRLATIFTVLFLLNPLIIFVILEIRLFALVVLLSILIIVSFYKTYYINNITPVNRILYIVLALSGLFTQYFTGFLLFANAVALLFRKNRRPFVIYIIDMILPLLIVILAIPVISMSIDVQTAALPSEDVYFGTFLIETTRDFVRRMFELMLPFSLNVSGIWYWTFRATVIVLLIISLQRKEIKQKLPEVLPFVIISVIIIFFFYGVAYLFSDLYTASKYAVVLFIPLLFTLVFLFRIVKPGLSGYWFILLVLIFLTADYYKYNKLYKIRDFPSLASYIEQNETPGEPVFIYRNIGAENLEIYYKGVNEIIPVPEPFDFGKKFGPEQWDISGKDLENLKVRFDNCNSFYVVINNMVNLSGFVESGKALLDYLDNNYDLLEKSDIKGDILIFRYSGKKGI